MKSNFRFSPTVSKYMRSYSRSIKLNLKVEGTLEVIVELISVQTII